MEYLVVYALGGILYALIELAWRGWTHWCMVLCGGFCFLIMYLCAQLPIALPKKWLLCTAAVTAAEFYTGCLVNLRLHWQVWDYSSERWHLLGQICPRFIFLWFGLSILGTALCQKLYPVLSRLSNFR